MWFDLFERKKRFFLYFMLAVLFFKAMPFVGTAAGGSGLVRILVDGLEIFEPEDAHILNGRTFAPIRPIVEAFNGELNGKKKLKP